VAGAHWAYQELGWGGLWAWDPVENASLLPWLATTAFLHAAVLVERRRRLHAWTAALALASFALALVGVYLTRSGVTGSVHAFAEARTIGFAFLAGVAAVVVGSGALLGKRWRQLGANWRPNGLVTREAALLANNVVLLAALVVVTAGTLAPLISKTIGAAEYTVAPTFFASLTALPALVALALVGIAPALPWSRRRTASSSAGDQHSPASGDRRRLVTAGVGASVGVGTVAVLGLHTPTVLIASAAAGVAVALSATQARRVRRQTRALAACLAHLGFALALFGIAGSTAGSEITGPLATGEELTLSRYRITQEGLIERPGERRSSVRVQLGLFVGDRRVGTLRPGLDTYHGAGGSGAPLPETALRSTPREDLLVTVVRIDLARGVAVLEVFHRPLVQWVWVGGLLVVTGGALALRQPSSRRPASTPPEPSREATHELASAGSVRRSE
jgi:cytochrome c-type biogenesis protein CcmF